MNERHPPGRIREKSGGDLQGFLFFMGKSGSSGPQSAVFHEEEEKRIAETCGEIIVIPYISGAIPKRAIGGVFCHVIRFQRENSCFEAGRD